MAGNPETLETSVSTTIKAYWEIQYSRFFNYPTSSTTSLSSTSLTVKPLSKFKIIRCKGTWISSSSTASLHLLTRHSLPQVILVVSLSGNIHVSGHCYARLFGYSEEHFISKLHFSWPQVSCLADCPIRGSRVIFACYRDNVGQIQKFAMRFSTSCDSQTFINTLKGSLRDVRNVEHLSCDFGSGIASQAEFISSNGVHYRADEGLSYVNAIGHYTLPVQPSLNFADMEYACSEETTLDYDLEGTCAMLPSSFTALLADCCAEAEQEPPKEPEEVGLKSQIGRYMTDSSFNGKLIPPMFIFPLVSNFLAEQ